MKRLLLTLLVLSLLALCACGAQPAPAAETVAPVESADESAPGVGTYTFTESALGGALEIPFTVELLPDGSYSITESNPMKGDIVYTGKSYDWRDTYFLTGPMDGGARPEAAWFSEDGGCVWIVSGEGEVTPMNYVPSAAPAEPSASGGAQGGEAAGRYTYSETNPFGMAIDWTLELLADGSYVLSEVNTMFPDGKSYTGSPWTQGHDTVTCGPMASGPEIFDWADPAGFTVTLSGESFTPEGAGSSSALPTDTGASEASLAGIAYGSDSPSQVLDVYLPEGDGPFPVIVLFHGGGFRFGDQGMSILKPVITAGTKRSYAVISADYRKSTEALFPAAVLDAKAAVRWVKENASRYGFDASRIAVWGESAGAYLACMTALTPCEAELGGDAEGSAAVQALVSFYAPVDFWTMDEDSRTVGISANTGDASSFESAFLGQAVNLDESFTRRAWWGSYSDGIPETLSVWIQAGDSDQRVPYLQSIHLGEQLTEILGEDQVQYGLIEGADHEDPLFYTDENLEAVFAFLDTALK